MLQKISNVSISARRPWVTENRNRLILIQEGTDRWEKFRCALQREDRPHFHRLFTRVRCYTQAATYQAHDNSMEAILLSIPLDQETRFTPSRKFFRTQGCFVKLLEGWILDLYRNQSHYHLSDSFAPAFYVTGPEDQLIRLQDAAQRKTTELRTRLTEPIGLGLNAARQELQVSVLLVQRIDDPSYENDPEDQLRPKTGRFCLRGGVGARSQHRQESCNRTSKERSLLGC